MTGPEGDWDVSGFEALEVELGSGDDHVVTGSGSDDIMVGSGGNIVNAGGGDDAVAFWSGADSRITGGWGTDKLTVGMAGGWLSVEAGLVSDGSKFAGFESVKVIGSLNGSEIVTLADGNESFKGFGGDDLAYGRAGDDKLDVGGGDDKALGETGDDTILGGTGDDLVYGGDNQDVMSGGEGDDLLSGGASKDTFVFHSGDDGVDRITHFQPDKDIILIGINLPGTNMQPLTESLFSRGRAKGEDGQFVLVDEGDHDRLVWDRNGDDRGGMSTILTIDGESRLDADDIFII